MATAEQKPSPFAGLKAQLANPREPFRDYVGESAAPPADIFVNFYPVAVHVFSERDRATDDAKRFCDAGFAKPNTAHYRRVADAEGKLL
jgi:hypothetical protein